MDRRPDSKRPRTITLEENLRNHMSPREIEK